MMKQYIHGYVVMKEGGLFLASWGRHGEPFWSAEIKHAIRYEEKVSAVNAVDQVKRQLPRTTASIYQVVLNRVLDPGSEI